MIASAGNFNEKLAEAKISNDKSGPGLEGCRNDMHTIHNYFKGINCQVTDSIMKYSMNEGTLPKKDILDTLNTFKKTLTGTETISGYDYGIIYYTGHGYRDTGNWAAADN